MTASSQPGIRTPRARRARLLGLVAASLVAATAEGATITVDVANDDQTTGDGCSLREAVINANEDNQFGSSECTSGEAGSDRIEFASSTNGTPIFLDDTGDDNIARVGDLDLRADVTIEGNGTGTTTINGNASDRVFDAIVGSIAVRVESLTVRNGGGVPSGAGIRTTSDVSLELIDVAVAQNTADGGSSSASGGGIHAGGPVVLDGAVLSTNTARSSGDSAFGGGLRLSSTSGAAAPLTIRDSRIVDNVARSSTSFAGGGGVRFQDHLGGSLTIADSVVRGNQAIVEGGASAHGAYGGGLEIISGGDATLRRTEVSANTADAAAGAASGGGIYVDIDAALVNVTVSGNTAVHRSGGAATGGGIWYGRSGTLDLDNATITDNASDTSASPEGGGLTVVVATVRSRNTVIAGNTADSPDCSGTIDSDGWTLLGDATGCTLTSATGNLTGVSPMLGPLADNGGSTRTHLPAENSPLVDAGDANTPGAGGTCATVDQRGETRAADGDGDGSAVCDVGAVEVRASGVGGGSGRGGGGGGGGGGGSAGPAVMLLLSMAFGWLRRHRPVAGGRQPAPRRRTGWCAATGVVAGEELWISDGTTDGTRLLKDINGSGPSLPRNFFALQ